jgi:hypothetical protein
MKGRMLLVAVALGMLVAGSAWAGACGFCNFIGPGCGGGGYSGPDGWCCSADAHSCIQWECSGCGLQSTESAPQREKRLRAQKPVVYQGALSKWMMDNLGKIVPPSEVPQNVLAQYRSHSELARWAEEHFPNQWEASNFLAEFTQAKYKTPLSYDEPNSLKH